MHDRITVLPEGLIRALEQHLIEVRRLHEADEKRGAGRVVLPEALSRKYPNASAECYLRANP